MSTGFYASKSTTVFMDLNTQAIVHAEYADHRMTNRHSAGLEYHNLEVGLAVIRSMGVEEIVSDTNSVLKALMGG